MNPNISKIIKGLHQDVNYSQQPESTYSFGLNVINETISGDNNVLSNEESNKLITQLPIDFIPIGKIYIGDNETAILSVNNKTNTSEIGILDKNDKYNTKVNDFLSPLNKKLNFNISKQIQGIYRLRLGCEKTIYFTGDDNKPRYYNFNKPDKFKTNSVLDNAKFDLIKTVKTQPKITKVEVLENTGSLLPGSYSVLLQHLDEDYNPTGFIELINNINIINDSLNNDYSDIQGSTNIDLTPLKSLETNKAIKITLSELDTTFTYYRLAFVEYTNGTGLISNVRYTEPTSLTNLTTIYTGKNAFKNGTIQELELANINIDIQKAQHIEQIDNLLVLANIEGNKYNFCNLQKFVSKIKTDVVIKDIILTSSQEKHNSKNPLVHYNGLSHQPGDIYSYGLIYIFEDNVESPVLHIPGKNNNLSNDLTFALGSNVKPMRSINNKNLSEFYTDESCNNDDYWGVDSEGQSLKNTNVRHHRFPTRDEINIGFVNELQETTNIDYKNLNLSITGIIKKSTTNPVYTAPKFKLIVKYKKNGLQEEFISNILTEFNGANGFFSSNLFLNTDVITDIKLFYKEEVLNSTELEIILTNNNSGVQSNNLTYNISNTISNEEQGIAKFQAPILGIKFSNITIPTFEEANGKIVGYKIVRQERKKEDKTILDSAVLLPTIKNNEFVSASIIAPIYDTGNYPNQVSENTTNILSPNYKFQNETFDGFTTIEEVGRYDVVYTNHRGHQIQDVAPGSTADGVENISDNTKDDDGYTLKQLVKITKLKYNKSDINKVNINNVNTKLYDLQPLSTALHPDEKTNIVNLSSDNKNLILATKENVNYKYYNNAEKKYPYVYIKKQNDFFYSNYRTDVYYQTDNKIYVSDTCELYFGDTHIVPYRHSNHIYGNSIAGRRLTEQSVVTTIVLITLAAALFLIPGVGTFAGTALLSIAIGAIAVAAGAVITFIAGQIEMAKFNDAYQNKWSKGLDFTLFDMIYQQVFYEPDIHRPKQQLSYRDDTIKFYGEVVGDFWFETTLNLSLRVPPTDGNKNYLLPLKQFGGNNQGRIQFLREVSADDEAFNGVDIYYRYKDESLMFEGEEETYFAYKILKLNKNKYDYLGLSTPIVYYLNADHNVNKGIKKYYALPQEYDCCSDCRESFPHRWWWSQQSFQEELSDNYRTFLPNNYKDITGETGEITNVFKYNNDLFVHTEEAIYQIPRNYQERVTDQIVSFIGTGSYGELPEIKIQDDETGNSGGCSHKWATIKTPDGVFFISEKQRKIFQFKGGQLKPISDLGLSNWFENNTEIQLDKKYYLDNNKNYQFKNNPSNQFGTGFISTYDTKKQRVIFTKKDFIINDILNILQDYIFTTWNNQLIVFNNFNTIIQQQNLLGWIYDSIFENKLKFKKLVTKTRIETRPVVTYNNVITTVPDNTCDFVQSLTINQQCSSVICRTKVQWINQDGSIDFRQLVGDNQLDTETFTLNKCIKKNSFIKIQGSGDFSFVKKECPSIITSFTITRDNAQGSGGFSITYTPVATNTPYTTSGTLILGQSFTVNEEIVQGSVSMTPDQDSSSFAYTQTTFTEDCTFCNKTVITQQEIIIQEDFIVEYLETEYKFIDGQILNLINILNNSWTISFSLKSDSWTSWHSYLPNFYIHTTDKFFSFNQDNKIWKHGIINDYLQFYNKYYDYIIEYVSVNNPLLTKVFDTLNFIVEVQKYDELNNEFIDIDSIFFNKLIAYNSKQTTGLQNIKIKDNFQTLDYINQQTTDSINTIVIDRNERTWSINDLRDYRVDYNKSIFKSDKQSVQANYYIDKILNETAIDYNKDWKQLESLRDKYLVVRLIFNSFVDNNINQNNDVKLMFNFSQENVLESYR